MIMLVFGAVGIILWIGGHDVVAGKLSAGALSAFVFYAAIVAGAVGTISEVVGDLQRAAGGDRAAVRIARGGSRGFVLRTGPWPSRSRRAARSRLTAVRFFYPSRPDSPALDDFTLDVAPGEKVALVGPSGAGKTTVFQLLLRFYDPQAGAVRIDGVDVRSADPRAVRGRLAVVPQDPVIFAATVLENVRYGRLDATDAEVRDACEAAFATDFIAQLPKQFESDLGERGCAAVRRPAAAPRDRTRHSRRPARAAAGRGNERARRPRASAWLQRALERLMAGRTVLIIAHRLATVRHADRIAVLEGGRLVAVGTHDELLAASPLYARLAALQFAGEGWSRPPESQ